MIDGSYEGICVEFEQKNKKTKQHGFPTFRLPPSTKYILRLTR